MIMLGQTQSNALFIWPRAASGCALVRRIFVLTNAHPIGNGRITLFLFILIAIKQQIKLFFGGANQFEWCILDPGGQRIF